MVAPDTPVGHERDREVHNTSIDEQVAAAELCGMTHLPSGRTCVLPANHTGGCSFEPIDEARRQAATHEAHRSDN
jgi:hypothetical protein